jgi:hypothetical protein
VNARRLGYREGWIVSKHLGGSRGKRHAANAEPRKKLFARPVVVEEYEPPSGAHEAGDLVDVESAVRVDHENSVFALELSERKRARDHDSRGAKLALGDSDEL